MNGTRPLAGAALLSLIIGCPQAGMPVLSLTARPSSIDGRGQTSTITVTGLTGAGNPGKGSVKLTPMAGSLDAEQLALDAMGTATAVFSCVTATDPACVGRVRIGAEWTSADGMAVGETRVTVGAAGGAGGGAAGGGSATGGGAAGGGTAGGGSATGGGGTGGGATAGGMGGGATAGGMGGGAAGGAMGGGTAVPDAGVRFVGDAGEVYLIGQVDESMTNRRLFSRIGTPNAPLLAFNDIGFDPSKVALRSDGTLLYVNFLTHELNTWVIDSWSRVGAAWQYPSDGGANDTVVPTPMCGAGNDLTDFWVRPDTGAIVYKCGTALTYYEGTMTLPALTGRALIAMGSGAAALARNGTTPVTLDVSGVEHNVMGLTASLSQVRYEVRATATGFQVPLPQSGAANAPCDSWNIAFDGTAQLGGVFANLPAPPVTAQFGCGLSIGRIDGSGALYSVALEGVSNVIYRRPIGGTAVRVYTEAGGFAPNFTTTPPTVFTFYGMVSAIVTGP